MDQNTIFALSQEAMFVLLIVSAPAMLVALVVGLAISLLQALTQIQEATLTFVPKIFAVLLTLSLSMSFTLNHMTDLTTKLYERIAQLE